MHRLLKVSPALCLLAFLFIPSTETRADVLLVTGGSVGMTNVGTRGWRIGGYDIRWGGNSRVSGQVTDVTGQSSGLTCNFPCAPGTTATAGGSSTLPTVLPGSFDIPGVFPPNVSPSMLSIGGRFQGSSLSFVTGAFVIPGDPNTADGLVTITTHFTMTGTIVVQNVGHDFQRTQVFSGEFFGSGIATITFDFRGFTRPGPQQFELRSVNYQFQPVPEPTTLILLGSGLAGLAARYRRRSRRQKEIS